MMKRTAKEMKCNLIFEELIIPQKLIPQILINLGYFFHSRKFIPAKYLDLCHPQKFIPAKCKIREGHPRKFIPAKLFFPRNLFSLKVDSK